jgi:hypothetical protein
MIPAESRSQNHDKISQKSSWTCSLFKAFHVTNCSALTMRRQKTKLIAHRRHHNDRHIVRVSHLEPFVILKRYTISVSMRKILVYFGLIIGKRNIATLPYIYSSFCRRKIPPKASSPLWRLFKPSTVDEIFRVFFQLSNRSDRRKNVGILNCVKCVWWLDEIIAISAIREKRGIEFRIM